MDLMKRVQNSWPKQRLASDMFGAMGNVFMLINNIHTLHIDQ